ncbi:MAG TPA: ATP-binding protein [Candidatus Limnocylindria bacterium]
MSALRRIRLLDAVAVLIAVGAAVASFVVWDFGRVNLGLSLRENDGRVAVHDVTPGGIAAHAGFFPGITVIEIATTDGSRVERGDPIGAAIDGILTPREAASWEIFWPIGGELRTLDSDYRLPSEPIDSTRIATIVAGDVGVEPGYVNAFALLNRTQAEGALRGAIWTGLFGVGAAALAWVVLRHVAPGGHGRRYAVLIAATIATPFVMAPVVAAGTAAGIIGAYVAPIVLAVLVGLAFAGIGTRTRRNWGAAAIAIGSGSVAVVTVTLYITSSTLSPTDPAVAYLLVALAAGVPAAIAAASRASWRERGEAVSLGLVPVAAMSSLAATNPQPIFPAVLLVALVGWQAAPARAMTMLDGAWRAIRPRGGTTGVRPVPAPIRDAMLVVLAGIVIIVGMPQESGLWAGIAAALGILTAWALRAGVLGDAWTDAAIPVAASIAIPVAIASFASLGIGDGLDWAAFVIALGALGVGHVLAIRHDDAAWQGRLFAGSTALAFLATFLGPFHEGYAILLAVVAPLVPGLPIAFAAESRAARAFTTRLESLALALTPAVAATVLLPSTNGIILWAWLVAIVIWRQFTLNPLLGMAERTQVQRDVAVAAAETERARLAADLHDDALQQLTMLVRTLDEKGQKEAADEAREIATKLRSVVGDLRLPILDDLGAGAALEWLVERVEPLAGGPVKLERSDESRPPANVELAVFRVAQEALTNAIKHGRPPIAVRYDVRTDGRVTLAIDDAGEGIGSEAAEEAPKEGHFGLVNMQQRAEQIGALLDVRRWPAGGTRVALEWRPQ